MDKSKWPQYMKDQYNNELRKRKRMKALIDEIHCPRLWEKKVDEESVFSFLAYGCEFNHVIMKILQKYIEKQQSDSLYVSSVYLFYTRKVFPGYYSDRERIVAMLNRYRETENFVEFLAWTDFFKSTEYKKYIHLMIGVFVLNIYLEDTQKFERLKQAIMHLEKAQMSFEKIPSKLAFQTLLAFGYYLREDFDSSVRLLEVKGGDEFQQDFAELIKKVA